MLLRGTLQLTIGDETRICEAGAMFLIPPNVPHRAVAVNGPAVVLDVFSPVPRGLRGDVEQVHSAGGVEALAGQDRQEDGAGRPVGGDSCEPLLSDFRR